MPSREDIEKDITQQVKLYSNGKASSFFKYCSNNSKVLDGIFKNKKIRFTQPRALNDPLEFSPTIRFNNLQARYQDYDLKGERFPSDELFFRVQVIESQINAYGILSLTKIPNSFTMWSQYSNGHRGFVIELKNDFWRHSCMKSKKGDEYQVRKIKYVDDYAINPDNLVNKRSRISWKITHRELFFKKTSRWAYEHEYRMVRLLSDCPYYKPPKDNYPYTDVKVYLFPFDWECVSSIILGANMPVENKMLIADCCKRHNIPLFQAHIIRDIKDWLGKPSTVLILSLGQYKSRDMILQSKPQLFCTDTIRLSNQNTVKIAKITDLPYYANHKEIVEQYQYNLSLDHSK